MTPVTHSPRLETVYFGSGCFWQKEHLFAQLHGVHATRVGYMGGWGVNPSAVQVSGRTTGHTEVVEVTFDTTQTKYIALLKAFFSFHDATVDRRRDGGPYRSIVFCRKVKHRIVTERAIALLHAHDLPVLTEIKNEMVFWLAEAKQQHYAQRTGRYLDSVPAPGLSALSLWEAAGIKPAEAKAFAPFG